MPIPGTFAPEYRAPTPALANPDVNIWLPGVGHTISNLSAFLSHNAVLNVLDFGADPTGKADSWTAFQTAVDAAGSAGGSQIIVPDGLYYLSAAVTLVSNVRISGQARSVVHDPHYRTNHHRFFNGAKLNAVIIEHLTIAGDNSVYATWTEGFKSEPDTLSNGAGIVLSNCTKSAIRNVHCQYLYESIVLKQCTDCLVQDTITEAAPATQGETEHGISLLGCNTTYIERAHVINGGDGALYIYNGADCSIRDSRVESTTGTGFTGCGVES